MLEVPWSITAVSVITKHSSRFALGDTSHFLPGGPVIGARGLNNRVSLGRPNLLLERKSLSITAKTNPLKEGKSKGIPLLKA